MVSSDFFWYVNLFYSLEPCLVNFQWLDDLKFIESQYIIYSNLICNIRCFAIPEIGIFKISYFQVLFSKIYIYYYVRRELATKWDF